MTMKNDTKVEEELTCRFEIDIRNSRALESLENFLF